MKIYTVGKNFTRPPVVTVATNLNSGCHYWYFAPLYLFLCSCCQNFSPSGHPPVFPLQNNHPGHFLRRMLSHMPELNLLVLIIMIDCDTIIRFHPHLNTSHWRASLVVAHTDDNYNKATQHKQADQNNVLPLNLDWFVSGGCIMIPSTLLWRASLDVAKVVVGPLLYSKVQPLSSMAITWNSWSVPPLKALFTLHLSDLVGVHCVGLTW